MGSHVVVSLFFYDALGMCISAVCRKMRANTMHPFELLGIVAQGASPWVANRKKLGIVGNSKEVSQVSKT